MGKYHSATIASPESTALSPLTARGGRLRIDPKSRSVLLNDRPVYVTTCEFDLLWCLAAYANRPVTRDQLYRLLLHIEYDGLDRRIDNQISRLRRRLGDDSRNPRLIKSIRSTGYQLVLD